MPGLEILYYECNLHLLIFLNRLFLAFLLHSDSASLMRIYMEKCRTKLAAIFPRIGSDSVHLIQVDHAVMHWSRLKEVSSIFKLFLYFTSIANTKLEIYVRVHIEANLNKYHLGCDNVSHLIRLKQYFTCFLSVYPYYVQRKVHRKLERKQDWQNEAVQRG